VELFHLRRYLWYTYRSVEVECNRMLKYNIVGLYNIYTASHPRRRHSSTFTKYWIRIKSRSNSEARIFSTAITKSCHWTKLRSSFIHLASSESPYYAESRAIVLQFWQRCDVRLVNVEEATLTRIQSSVYVLWRMWGTRQWIKQLSHRERIFK
jgi:hypothetical protein